MSAPIYSRAVAAHLAEIKRPRAGLFCRLFARFVPPAPSVVDLARAGQLTAAELSAVKGLVVQRQPDGLHVPVSRVFTDGESYRRRVPVNLDLVWRERGDNGDQIADHGRDGRCINAVGYGFRFRGHFSFSGVWKHGEDGESAEGSRAAPPTDRAATGREDVQ